MATARVATTFLGQLKPDGALWSCLPVLFAWPAKEVVGCRGTGYRLWLAGGLVWFEAKGRGDFGFEGIGNVGVVCAVAVQDGKGFLFPTRGLNCDDDAAELSFAA